MASKRKFDQVESSVMISVASQNETQMEPVDLIDCTIHFKGHSFHGHSQVLSVASNHLKEALKAARNPPEPYQLSSACAEAGHRCVKLPDQLGGSDYNVKQFLEFMNQLYNPALGATKHKTIEESTAKLAFYFDCPALRLAQEHH